MLIDLTLHARTDVKVGYTLLKLCLRRYSLEIHRMGHNRLPS
jgi:hypothetical protein